MPSHLARDIPVVVICNISETFYSFLKRAEDPAAQARLIHGEQYRGDRALLWLGDSKLVFVTFPIPHAQALYRQLGYRQTRYLAPHNPSPQLCQDILREAHLLTALIEYAGAQRTAQIIPYATTPEFLQLVDVLRREHGLTVRLPESPAPECLWVRDYIDTKAGFRVLASRWLGDRADTLLPSGVACEDWQSAAAVAHWFCLNGQTCVVKADDGENGIGQNVLRPGEFASVKAIHRALERNPFLHEHGVTVEAYIPSAGQLSPSLEVFVPPFGAGQPEITYLSRQLFLSPGDFCGVLVSRELREAGWYPALAESGLRLAEQLQAMGYVGHFDMDTIVDDGGRLFLLEVNSRRTGGTHVHEFARFTFGPDYLGRVALLSHDAMSSGAIREFERLQAALGDLAYPMRGERRGVILTVTSALAAGEFGCLIAAASAAEALTLQQAAAARVRAAA
ncbi:MAG TPA: hypothetical protein VI793_15740 [Anaerolineales bacterium]|nr:hypothetical protein [Anaerolineales bacterium]